MHKQFFKPVEDIEKLCDDLKLMIENFNRQLYHNGWMYMDPSLIIAGSFSKKIRGMLLTIRKFLLELFKLTCELNYKETAKMLRDQIPSLPSNEWTLWIVEPVIEKIYDRDLTRPRSKLKEFYLDILAPNRIL